MTERAIHHQQQRQILSRIVPVVNTYDEIIKNKLVFGKFPFTKVGLIKIIGMILLIASLAIFFGKASCTSSTSGWYDYLLPITDGLSIIIISILYVIFAVGLTVRSPGIWDISVNIVLAILIIISSIMTIVGCSDTSSIQNVPGALGITAGVTSLIGGAALFLMYRYVEDDEIEGAAPPKKPVDPRKSYFA